MDDKNSLKLKRDKKIANELNELRKNAKIKISNEDFAIIKLSVCGLFERLK